MINNDMFENRIQEIKIGEIYNHFGDVFPDKEVGKDWMGVANELVRIMGLHLGTTIEYDSFLDELFNAAAGQAANTEIVSFARKLGLSGPDDLCYLMGGADDVGKEWSVPEHIARELRDIVAKRKLETQKLLEKDGTTSPQ